MAVERPEYSITVKEAIRRTGVKKSKAYELIAAGVWPSYRLEDGGRTILIPVEGLRRWMEEREAVARMERERW